MSEGEFLATRTDIRPWVLPEAAPAGLEPLGLYVGPGRVPLEVAVAAAPRTPSATQLRELWQARHGNTPSPLLLVVLHPGRDGALASNICATIYCL